MPDTWILIPRTLLKKMGLEKIMDRYPDDIVEMPFGYFAKDGMGPVGAQIKMFVLIEAIRKWKP